MSERYEILEKIGQGGRGHVYRAIDTRLKREVAIKRIPVEPGSTPEQIEKIGEVLIKEATAMSVLNHPNIVSIYDIQQDAEGGFVVMELLNGDTLHDVVKRNVLTLEDFHSVAQQSLEALIAAGASNMLHRDLKPGNIMLVWLPSNKFQIKILDFGLAKISAQPSLQTVEHGRSIVGTIYFMAPEQFELRELSAATDLYAMGCVYYFCLTGKYPFDGESMAKVMTAHLQGTYEPLDKLRPDLPRHLCQWVMWLMNRDARHRPQTAQDALDRLPLATSKEGEVYVVQALEVEAPATAVGTGKVAYIRPADLVADPAQPTRPTPSAPAHQRSPQPSTPSTGGAPTTTGRIPTSQTGRVAPRMQTGRVQGMGSPAAATGTTSTVTSQGSTEQAKGWLHPLLIIGLVLPLLTGGILLAVKMRIAADYPIRFSEVFQDQTSGLLHASKPASPPLPLLGRLWTATPGLKLTGEELLVEAGRQLATFDLTGTYAASDTIRMVVTGIQNPNAGWIGLGLTDRDAPGVVEDDLVGWVSMSGDKHSSPGSGSLNEQGFRKKKVTFPKDSWKAGAKNDIELVLNCDDGQAALFVNGVRALITSIKDSGFTEPPKRLALVFANVPGTTIEGVKFENLGICDLMDIGPSIRASRSHLENLPPPPVTR